MTLAVIARPILDKFYTVNFERKLVSSVDPRIEVTVGKKQADCQRSLLLQVLEHMRLTTGAVFLLNTRLKSLPEGG